MKTLTEWIRGIKDIKDVLEMKRERACAVWFVVLPAIAEGPLKWIQIMVLL